MGKNYETKVKLYNNVYNDESIFKNFICDLGKNNGSQIAETDIIKSTDGVRINLNSNSVKGINEVIRNYLEQYCNDNNDDFYNYHFIETLYNITYINDSVMLIL